MGIPEPANAVDVGWQSRMFDSADRNTLKLLRARKSGSLGQHRDGRPIPGLMLNGPWCYSEPPRAAEPGAHLYPSAGDVETMFTLVHINGPVIHADDDDTALAIDDNMAPISRVRVL